MQEESEMDKSANLLLTKMQLNGEPKDDDIFFLLFLECPRKGVNIRHRGDLSRSQLIIALGWGCLASDLIYGMIGHPI